MEVQQPTEQPMSDLSVTPAIPASPSDSLAWLPATSAAISLRLFAIDAAIIYRPGDPPGREVIQVRFIVSIAGWVVCQTKLAFKALKLWLAISVNECYGRCRVQGNKALAMIAVCTSTCSPAKQVIALPVWFCCYMLLSVLCKH